jgi:hypothetical protein
MNTFRGRIGYFFLRATSAHMCEWDPVNRAIVFTMGKVGSTAVNQALKRARIPSDHIHTLTERQINAGLAKAKKNKIVPAKHLGTSHKLIQDMKNPEFEPIYITLIRDPVATNLSAFFTNRKEYELSLEDSELNAESAFNTFLACYPHDTPVTWLNRQFFGELGIDLLSQDFCTEKRYAFYPDLKTIVFRTDCPDSIKGEVLSVVFDREVKVQRSNISDDKVYSGLYKRVRRNAKFSSEYLDRMYESQFAKHFWSDSERNEMRERWCTRP